MKGTQEYPAAASMHPVDAVRFPTQAGDTMGGRHTHHVSADVREALPQAERWRRQAELLDLSARARLRLEWLIFYETVGAQNATATARYFGISRETFYYWRRRFGMARLRGLEDEPSTPKTTRSWRPDPVVLERMLALRRRYPAWGKETLAAVYWTWYGEKVSPWQFQRMISQFRMQRSRARRPGNRRRDRTAKQRISYAVRRNARQLWQLDTVVLAIGRHRRYVVTAVEHATKLGYAYAYERATSRAATDFLSRLAWFTGRPTRVVLTDNGSEFAGRFDAACKRHTMVRYYSRPRRPTDNPECERFNQTLQREWLEAGNEAIDVTELNRTLAEWVATYNRVRPHHALGLRTPVAVAQETRVLSTKSPAVAGISHNQRRDWGKGSCPKGSSH
jgi:transposase InsO family protein